jgi:hypothetical protein
MKVSKIIFLHSILCKLALQRNDLPKYVNYKKGALLKTMFDNGFQNVIYKLYALILKGLFSKP